MFAGAALIGAGAGVAAILAALLRQARGPAAERSRGLARSEARYQELVEQVAGGIYVPPEYRFTRATQAVVAA